MKLELIQRIVESPEFDKIKDRAIIAVDSKLSSDLRHLPQIVYYQDFPDDYKFNSAIQIGSCLVVDKQFIIVYDDTTPSDIVKAVNLLYKFVNPFSKIVPVSKIRAIVQDLEKTCNDILNNKTAPSELTESEYVWACQ